MARCLHEKGYRISGLFDLETHRAVSLAQELGATACVTLAEVTATADVVFTVVTNDAAMDAVFFGKDNLFIEAQGTDFINCATLSPRVHRHLERAAERVGARCMEACMASSIPQARQGELFLMIGGREAVYTDHKQLLMALSSDLHFVGPAGKAAEVKALVNMVMNINTAALAEGLGLGAALGLDLERLCRVFRQTGAHSRVLETDAEDMIHRDHECYFSAEHAAKDAGIALGMAESLGVQLPLARATLDQYLRLVKSGKGQLDKSGVAELTFPGRAAD